MTDQSRAKKIEEQINKMNNLALDPSPFGKSMFLNMRDTWINDATEHGFKVTGTTLKGYKVRVN